MEKLITAIIFCEPADPLSGNVALKYRKITNSSPGITAFMQFAKGFTTAQYVNFYGKQTKKYCGRIYFDRAVWAAIDPQKKLTLQVYY